MDKLYNAVAQAARETLVGTFTDTLTERAGHPAQVQVTGVPGKPGMTNIMVKMKLTDAPRYFIVTITPTTEV